MSRFSEFLHVARDISTKSSKAYCFSKYAILFLRACDIDMGEGAGKCFVTEGFAVPGGNSNFGLSKYKRRNPSSNRKIEFTKTVAPPHRAGSEDCIIICNCIADCLFTKFIFLIFGLDFCNCP